MLDWTKKRARDPFLEALTSLSVPVFAVEKGRDGIYRMVYLSRELQEATGFEIDAIEDRRIDRIFPPRMASAIASNYDTALTAAGAIHFDEAYCLKTRDTWWRTTLNRAPDSPDGHPRIVGFTSEISDIKNREAQIVADLADLRVAFGEVQMLAGLTAHDMRAPLANVISLTAIVLDGFRDLGDGKRDMIMACRDVAQSSIEAIDSLMQRILTETPSSDRAVPFDLEAMCPAIICLVDPTERLKIRYPRATVECDEAILNACLRNMLDNATRFAERRIDITLEDVPERRAIAVSVRDDGPGLATGQDPIARAESARGDARGGFGLATILRLLKSQGGSLSYSRPDNGTGACFRAELPGRIVATGEKSAQSRAGIG